MSIMRSMAIVGVMMLSSGAVMAGDDLPAVETLRADSDYTRFMQPDVPHAVRAAALSRLWVLDPAIRSASAPSEGDWWQAGAPGCGAAPAAAEIRTTLEQLHRRLDMAETPVDTVRAALLAGALRANGPGG